jgi:phytoene dehydrogenase-like protein
MEPKKKKTVIAGAGMAGLTAAAYLLRDNFDVLILEKNDKIGGLVGTFEKNGFYFDSGPRAYVNSGIIKPILGDLGINCDYLENKISLGIEDHFLKVNSITDLQEYQEILTRFFPENKGDITAIGKYMNQISEYTKILYEFDNPNFSNQMTDKNYVFTRLLPWVMKFLGAMKKLNSYNMPMETFLGGLTQNQSLIDVITQHFFRKTPTYFALGYFYVYMDYFYPKGGTGTLNRLLGDKITQAGGEIKLNKKVSEVLPAESRIIDAEGNSYPYDQLIWAADLKTLYRSLNPTGLDPKTRQKVESESALVLASKGAESVFIINVAVNRPPSYFQQHGGAHLFFTPSREGLRETARGEREILIRDFEHKSKDEILAWLDRYLRLNTYEISIPVLRDATLAPEGQTGVMISCLFDFELFKKVSEAGWYDEFKDEVENRICIIISQTIYKDMTRDILFQFSSSPLTISNLSGSSEGAITGWTFENKPPVVNKLKDIPKSVNTSIPKVYQAGQWAYSPAGVPIAMLTGWYAAKKIIKLAKKK